ncbi:MAG: zinc-binding alcohol dehydrogenase [candidate division Zixibacteria bacterium]|nr:zinc-binding alcohol dehydrogenase [candidate division Zixibacteria bacterium]
MKSTQFVVVEPGRIELQEADIDESLQPYETLVRSEYTIVSAGTEGAGFTGLVKEMPFGDSGQYPRTTGYGHLGEVLAVGAEVSSCKPGDRVLSFSRHASVVKVDTRRMALPTPKETPGTRMVFARMAGVSIGAVRSSSVQPGDTVLVVGMGLVGNFACQLFRLAGAEVMAVDLSDFRLERAKRCGIERTVNPNQENLKETVMAWTEGKGARIVVEAIGNSRTICEAALLTRSYGELILLGSPRARAQIDVTPMLLHIHMEAIRMIGALEWRWPTHESERDRSLLDNYRQIVRWIAEDRIVTEPLLSHLARPTDCQRIYEGLTQRREEFLSGVFDWKET